jgi:hypothetical protein
MQIEPIDLNRRSVLELAELFKTAIDRIVAELRAQGRETSALRVERAVLAYTRGLNLTELGRFLAAPTAAHIALLDS